MTIGHDQTFSHFDTNAIDPSKTNPRKQLGNLAELEASVRDKGIIEPLILRKHPTKAGRFELVCGERRWTAGKNAGLKQLPGILRELTDDEVLDIQLAENLERADLSPIEEAEAFGLRMKRGQTVAHIAERIGRPARYVLERAQLLELAPAVRDELARGRITLGVAFVIARLPGHKLQAEALKEIGTSGTDERWERSMNAKEAAEHIRDHYLLRLAGAGFDRADSDLTSAPACTVCPKRTGAQAELFDDVKSPDLCTDPVCFRAKLDATWKKRSAAAKREGVPILSQAEAKKVFHNHHHGPHGLEDAIGYDAGFKSLDDDVYVGSRSVKVRKLLEAPKVTIAQNPHTGRILELVPKATVDAAVRKRRAQKAAEKREPSKKLTPAQKAAKERDRQKAEATKIIKERSVAAAVEQIEGWGDLSQPLLLVLEQALRDFGLGPEAAIARRGIVVTPPKGKRKTTSIDHERALLELARDKSESWIVALLVELTLGDSELARVCKLFGVDTTRIEAEAEAELKAKREADKAAAKDKGAAPTPGGARRNATPSPEKVTKRAKPKALESPALKVTKAAKHAKRGKLTEMPGPDGEGTVHVNDDGDVVCRGCGCSEFDPCPDGCAWVEPDLCSRCAGGQPEGRKPAKKAKRAGKR